MRRFRPAIAVISAVLAGGGLFVAAVLLNPVLTATATAPTAQVRGPLLLDSLALAYLLPALLLLLAGWKLPDLAEWVRRALLAIGAAGMTLFVALEMRRFREGDRRGGGRRGGAGGGGGRRRG